MSPVGWCFGAQNQMNRRTLKHLDARLAPLALLAMLSGSGEVRAAAGEWQKSDFVEARLISAVEGTGQLDAVPLGVEVRLKEKWKTYWRSPGDAGLPPALDWAGSSNLKSASLAFPTPHRFTLFNHQTFGYKDHVVFPVLAGVTEAGRPLDLKAKFDILVCADICVPQTLDLSLAIGAGHAQPGLKRNSSTDSRPLCRMRPISAT